MAGVFAKDQFVDRRSHATLLLLLFTLLPAHSLFLSPFTMLLRRAALVRLNVPPTLGSFDLLPSASARAFSASHGKSSPVPSVSASELGE